MKRKPLTHLEVVLAASLVITCTPTAEADESSLDFSATGREVIRLPRRNVSR